MLIDWFTVAAQAVNFLVLVWLLKRFLYRPILDAIDAREKRIAARLQAAEEKMAGAERQRADYQAREQALERQRGDLLAQAGEQARAERLRLLDEARREAEQLRARLDQSLRNERRELLGEVATHARQEVFAIARKTLSDLAAADLEQRIADVLVRRLDGLGDEQRQDLARAFKASSQAPLVRSAFELAAAQREAIEQAVGRLAGAGIALRFETAPGLVGGIELVTDGHKLGWNIADYLAALEHSMGELIERKYPAAPQGETGEPAA